MRTKVLLALIAAISPVLTGCQPTTEGPATNSSPAASNADSVSPTPLPNSIALAAKDELFKKLSTRLVSAMSSGGPAAAISVCSSDAPKIANAIGKDHGVTIGRTSYKLRNPMNSPPKWAQPLIEERLAESSTVELPDGRHGTLFPIHLKVQCLTCHGPSEQITNDIKNELARLYPDDQATGFKEGDLRGWFWVEVPARNDQSHTSVTSSAASPTTALLPAQEAFAHFDAIYIPALALTKQEKAGPSQTALQRLAKGWHQLRPSLQQAIAEDSNWAQDLATIDTAISTAAGQCDEGQLMESHESLEVIRDLMMNARRRQHIFYALDSLSDFHVTMEEIVKPAMKLTPETLTDAEVRRLTELVQLADNKWQTVEATQFELDLFDIAPDAAASFPQLIKAERQAIRAMQAALADGDYNLIIKAARGLKPPFAKVYMFFGSFPSPSPQP